jgi:hypothetical protein
MSLDIRQDAEMAYKLVADAGGEIVGRTKIQKIAYFLEAMGAGHGFHFTYKHYGPFSDELSSSVKYARIYDMISEEERPTAWGGFYSVFRTIGDVPAPSNDLREAVIQLGNDSDPVELELAATAAYLAKEGTADPWRETEKRKPDKVGGGRLRRAKALYRRFLELDENHLLPAIV